MKKYSIEYEHSGIYVYRVVTGEDELQKWVAKFSTPLARNAKMITINPVRV